MRRILCDGRVMIQDSRRLFTGFGDFTNEVARTQLSMKQMHAMDTIEFLARKHCLSMTLQKGDIQWANNLSVLHSRDSFRDDESNV